MKALDNLSQISSLLVVCPTWVGDMVMATPMLRGLREKFPQARMTLCLRPALVELVEGGSWCDRILIYDKRRTHKGVWGWARFIRELRSSSYDIAVSLPNSLRSGFIVKFSGAPVRIGYERPLGLWSLTHVLPRPREGNKIVPIYTGLYYSKLADVVSAPSNTLQPELPLTEGLREQAQRIWQSLPGIGARIIITPGASFGPSKLWPQPYFAQVIDLLGNEYNAKFILAPGPGEEEISQKIESLAKYPVTIIPPQQASLGLLKGLIRTADLLISNDTGPRHIAHAFQTPAIILIGPNDRRHTDTTLEKAQVLHCDMPCSPCNLKMCPYEHHGCMTGILPEEVYSAAKKFLTKS